MVRDLFAAPVNGHKYIKSVEDLFRWVVAIFSQDGATRAIIKANNANLLTYYPVRFNNKGEPVPLFRNYLCIQFVEDITINLCRGTPKFVKILTAHDDEGLLRPMLVRRNAVDENKAMVLAGRFNERFIRGGFYGKGSIVAVLHGIMATRRVRLEEDILAEWRGNHRVKVDMNGVKGLIEIHKLAL
jgi:hypothetical protein